MSDGQLDLIDYINDVKSNYSPREVVKQSLNYEPEKDGIKDYRANCPTGHPSSSGACFVVNDELMFCHSCGKFWDQISFVQDFFTDGDFMEALFLLARWGNTPLPENINFKSYTSKRAKLKRLIDLNEKYVELTTEAMTKDEYNLIDSNWGMKERFAKKTKIGFTTSSVTKKMLKAGFSEKELKESGLFIQTKKGLQPFFIGRITIPYMVKGSPRYFIGRKTDLTPDNKFEKAKYKKLPCYSEKRPYLHREIRNDFLYGQDELLKTQGRVDLIITEGIADCIILLQEGFKSVSPVTIRFRKQDVENIRKLLGKPESYVVYISLDNDPNSAGQDASLSMAESLTKEGYDVRIVKIPLDARRVEWREIYSKEENDEAKEKSKRDTADYIKEEGTEAFKRLLKEAPKYLYYLIDQVEDVASMEFSSMIKEVAELATKLPENIVDELVQYIKSKGTNTTVRALKKTFIKVKKESVHLSKIESGDLPAEDASALVVEKFIPCSKYDPSSDDFFRFKDTHYTIVPGELVKQEIESEIEKCSSDFLQQVVNQRNKRITDSFTFLRRKSATDPSFFSQGGGYLALKNGVLDLQKRKLVTHSPDIPVFNAVEYNFDKNASCPLWKKTVKEVLEEKDKIELFQFFCGYVFSGHYKYHKALFLIGDGANGKSTLLDAILFVFGNFNVSTIGLHQLGSPFMLIKLKGMLANIASESCEKTAIESSVFKEAVSGGNLIAGDKFKSNVTFRNQAKFFQAMNNFPIIPKKSHGVLRRLEFLSCDKDFSKLSKPDYDIGKKLLNEASGILNWCLEGLDMLEDAGGFITPKDSKRMLHKFTDETCSVTKFLNEEFSKEDNYASFVITSDDSFVSKQQVYDSYNYYCRRNGLKPHSSVPFWKIFWKQFPELKEYRSRESGRCVKGLKASLPDPYQVPSIYY